MKKMVKSVPNFDGYDSADICLNSLIKVLKDEQDKISQQDMEDIFSIINENRQFYDKTRTNRNRQISEFSNLGFDLSNYENLTF